VEPLRWPAALPDNRVARTGSTVMSSNGSGLRAADCNTPEQHPFDLYIVGLGIVSVRQVTREAEAAMRRSTEILYASDAIGIDSYLQELCGKVTEVYVSTLREDEERLSKYNRIAAMVIEAALDHAPVSFAIAGHPLVFVYPTQQILAVADQLGLRVKVLPGISSFDCMIVDLQLDPGSLGVQMFETTGLLLQQRQLQPDVPCFLWQVGSVETRLFTRAKSVPGRFTRLQNHLLKYYPAAHRVKVVYSSSHPLAMSTMLEFRIDEMHLYAEHIHPGATLYIPPARLAEVKDHELAKLVDNLDHLKSITQQNEQPTTIPTSVDNAQTAGIAVSRSHLALMTGHG
jgi:tetrapyrrole methylase family protein / MazG family protein